MPKNLLVFSDGTGNAGGKSRDTNVYRLYNSIDRGRGLGDETEQRTHYDDGVGTSDNAVVKAITGAFGMGLSRNIRQLYAWLIENYEVGDRIYIFGFSRGAFTARCLAGMVKRCGLLKKEVYQGLDVKERDRRLRRELKAYRAAWEFAFKYWHPAAEAPDYHQPRIHFVGVWDTVDAVGMPVDELRPIFDHVWRGVTLRRMYGFSDRLLAGVEHARHAVALDDERRTFHPNVWYKHPKYDARKFESDDPKRPTDPRQIKQVWFAGVHSNVGGGYPKDHLAMVALDWMMGELENLPDHPVRFIRGARRRYQEHSNAEGQQYNPRSGPAAYYRYSPRRVTRFYKGTDDIWKRWWRILFRRPSADLPSGGIAVHASVFERIQHGPQNYAPLFLPDRKENLALTIVETAPNVERDGEAPVKSIPFGPGTSAALVPVQALVSDTADAMRAKLNALVIGRQVVYGITVGVTAAAVLAGFGADVAVREAADGKVEILGCTFHFNADQVDYVISSVVPEVAHRLVDAAILYPERALAYLTMMSLGWLVSRKVRLKMVSISRGAYDKALAELSLNPPGSPTAD